MSTSERNTGELMGMDGSFARMFESYGFQFQLRNGGWGETFYASGSISTLRKFPLYLISLGQMLGAEILIMSYGNGYLWSNTVGAKNAAYLIFDFGSLAPAVMVNERNYGFSLRWRCYCCKD